MFHPALTFIFFSGVVEAANWLFFFILPTVLFFSLILVPRSLENWKKRPGGPIR